MPHRFTVTIHERARSSFWQARIFLAGEGGRERRWSTGIAIGRGADVATDKTPGRIGPDQENQPSSHETRQHNISAH